MNATTKKNLYMTVCFAAVSVLFTILVKTVGVKDVGPAGTSVGFAGLNVFIFNLVGQGTFFYLVTKIIGLFAIVTVGAFGLLGLYMLIKEK
nr:phosphoesterase PA-phosphatase [Lachnospiraceae bacterium]